MMMFIYIILSPAERAIDPPPKGRYHNYTKGRSSVVGERPNFFSPGQHEFFEEVVNFIFLKPRSTLIFKRWSDSIFKPWSTSIYLFAFLHSRSAGEPFGILASVICGRWSAPVWQPQVILASRSKFRPSHFQLLSKSDPVWTMVNRSPVKHSLVKPVTVMVRSGMLFLFGQHGQLVLRWSKHHICQALQRGLSPVNITMVYFPTKEPQTLCTRSSASVHGKFDGVPTESIGRLYTEVFSPPQNRQERLGNLR